MALILNIETSTKVCSVALSQDGKLLSIKEHKDDYSHSELITIYIQNVLNEAGFKGSDVDAVSVSKGPGSYTGLRIGVSTAKGLCYALNKPLISVNTLQAMAYGILNANKAELPVKIGKNMLLCPMIDARRMEVFTAFYDSNNKTIIETSAEVIDKNSFKDIFAKHEVVFFGNGSDKCREAFKQIPNAHFIENIHPSSMNMIALSEKLYKEKLFEDVAYFEPFYLKDFVTTTPKKSVL